MGESISAVLLNPFQYWGKRFGRAIESREYFVETVLPWPRGGLLVIVVAGPLVVVAVVLVLLYHCFA